MMKQRGKKAVSPVLATLMMVAVAVALSVIIFTWSQGFLSQTGEAAQSGQQAQNIAAQSGILIESATFDVSDKYAIVYVRNVGATSIDIGTVLATGKPGQGFQTSSTTAQFDEDLDGNFGESDEDGLGISKGSAVAIKITGLSGLAHGDVVTFKITTKVGTFAQATYVVP
jgi:flagellin-like protein